MQNITYVFYCFTLVTIFSAYFLHSPKAGPGVLPFHPYFSNFFLGAIGTASNMDIEGGRGPARFFQRGDQGIFILSGGCADFFGGGLAQILLHYFSVGMLPLFEPKMNLLF